jgi:hypothetical protein
MNERDYRVVRVKVSDKVRDTIANLIARENDIEKKKKYSAKWYRDEVAKQLKLKDKDNPSLRSYEVLIQGIRKSTLIDNPLDKPWSVGACQKFNIPAGMIPTLIEIQQFIKTKRLIMAPVTIRQAKWFSSLYSIVLKLIKKHYSEATIALELYQLLVSDFQDSARFEKERPETSEFTPVELIWLVIIGCEYANKERVSELIREDYADTSELDNLHFIREDCSVEAIVDGSWNAFATPEQKKERSKFLPKSVEDLEKVFGKLNENQVDLANDFARALYSSAISARVWKEQHPEEFAELKKLWKVKENERLNNQTV